MKRLLALSLFSAIVLSACQSGGGDTIKLGFIGPVTGDTAALGKDSLHGVQMAIQEANAKGGVNGKKVELVAEDGRCNGTDGASAAQKLVNIDKVVAIIGGLCSSETLAADPIAGAGKVVLLSAGSSSPAITTKGGDFTFRNYPSDALKAVAMAKYIKQKGWKKIAIISENTDYCTGLRDAVVKQVGAASFVFNEAVEPGTKDFRSLLTRLKSTDFDVFITNTNGDATIALMVQQFREQGFTQPLLGADTADSQVVVDTGAAAEGMQIINVPTAGEGKPFEKTFTDAFGKAESSISWAAYSYDATNILLKAIADNGTDGTAMKDALYTMTYTGIVGTIHFDKYGDPVGIPYVVKEIKDGKIVTVQDLPID